ncbi:protein phosphatase Slingshot homolog 1-like isoform X2 [Antedon mediterranea]|uniref:protein phosphatase Slingshot homolog 1-like isoform X2 n=3 Tax=Antedon mediterranea TaxID=105859 RepID=UPI003AF5984D
MSLVTVQRSPTNSSNSSTISVSDNEDEVDNEKRIKKISVNESFFAVKGAALVLSHSSEIPVRHITKHPVIGELQFHLQSIFYLLRSKDSIKLAVRLESIHEGRLRYMVLVSCIGREDTEENVILGIDIGEKGSTIGLVQEIYTTTCIVLDGDGGFSVSNQASTRIYKPVSVQAMWSAFQALHRASMRARRNNYIPDGLNHSWTGYYRSSVRSTESCINEWDYIKDIVVLRPEHHTILSFVKEIYAGLCRPSEKDILHRLIRVKLKEIMLEVDLDEITCRQIRLQLEDRMDKDLKEYKGFIDEQMLLILGQIDAPSLIFDYLYLGSEWNASNYDELEENQIGYILNITKEIDNFFPSTITYHNVREYDIESTYLLKYWDDTYKFIKSAKMAGSKILVHCKMGISRSASSVIAYIMKEYKWPMKRAFDFVKGKRKCIKPNSAFMNQLVEYQGILDASNQRLNPLWRSKSESSLSACSSEAHDTSEIFSSTEDLLLTPEVNVPHRSKSWCNRKDFPVQEPCLEDRNSAPAEEVISFQVEPTKCDSDSSSETVSLDGSCKTSEDITANRLSVGEVVKQIEQKGSEPDTLIITKRPNSLGDALVTVTENAPSLPTPDVFSPEDVDTSKVPECDADATIEGDTGDVQLNATKKYELESIPWNPGTVLKQKQDIEERLKDVKEASPPAVRSEKMRSRPGSEEIQNVDSDNILAGEVKRMSSELAKMRVEEESGDDTNPAIIIQLGNQEQQTDYNVNKVESKDKLNPQSTNSNSSDQPPSKVLSPTICGLEPGIVKKKTERFSSIIDGFEDSTTNEKPKDLTEDFDKEETSNDSTPTEESSKKECKESEDVESKEEECSSEQRLSKVFATGEIVPLPEGTVRRQTKDYEQLLSDVDKTLLDQAGDKDCSKKGTVENTLTPIEVSEIRDLGKIMLCREPSDEDSESLQGGCNPSPLAQCDLLQVESF